MGDFQNLFSDIFGIKGNCYPEIRENKKKVLYCFRSYSKEIFNKISYMDFPIGFKKHKLRIPPLIWNFRRKEKLLFLKGLTITDGSIRSQGNILFHLSSKKFLEDVSDLIYELFGLRKPIKEYLQREKFYSYQLLLNKKQAQEVLKQSL